MPFSTYIRGIRQGHTTTTLTPIIKRLARLAEQRRGVQEALADLVGTEVRVTLPNGTERLYAVLVEDPKTGVLHLRDVEGHDTVIN